jgi:membrane glycosyltransferase
MGAVTIDPKIEPRILPLLSKGEQLLWAAKRQGPSSRQWKELWIVLIVAGIVIAATTFWFGPYAVIWLVAINLLFHMPSRNMELCCAVVVCICAH